MGARPYRRLLDGRRAPAVGSRRRERHLEELPDRYTSLLFLAGDEPVFTARQEGVTLEAVGKVAELFQRLEARHEGDSQSRRLFVLQVV